MILKPPILFDNNQTNISMRQDAGVLVNHLTEILGGVPEIVYLNPPYNQHPYDSNYHFLNTIVLWDKPKFPKKITKETKSAIRLDWRSERKSRLHTSFLTN